MAREKVLSIFIDESGDLGEVTTHSPFYLFALVFHNQDDDISSNVARLNEQLAYDGFTYHAIHTGPLIRREKDYRNFSLSERQKLFKRLFYFARKCPVSYKTFIFKKDSHSGNNDIMIALMSGCLSEFIAGKRAFFSAFTRIIVYYDNGQHELNRILIDVFTKELANITWRTVLPVDYRLFQVADMMCTLELIRIKLAENSLSASERHFFVMKDLRKTYLSGIDALRFD